MIIVSTQLVHQHYVKLLLNKMYNCKNFLDD